MAESWRKYAVPDTEDEQPKPAATGWRAHAVPDKTFSVNLENPLPTSMRVPQAAMPETGFARSVGEAAMQNIVKFGKFVDSYGGAPSRAAVAELQKSGDIIKATSAFTDQFGKDPEKAPSGREIAIAAGVKPGELITIPWKDPTTGKNITVPIEKADAVGLAIDFGADVTNFIPGKAAVKGMTMAAKGTAKGIYEGTKGAANIASYIATGKTIGKHVPEFARTAAKETIKTVEAFTAPKYADDLAKMIQTAEKHGIDPTLLPEGVLFGEKSLLTKAAQSHRTNVLGEPDRLKFAEGLRQVRQAFDGQVEKIGKGNILTAPEAGAAIKASYDDAVRRFFDAQEDTYNSIIKNNPGLMLDDQANKEIQSAITAIERFAAGRVKRGITDQQRSQALGLLNAAESLRETKGSVKQMTEAMRMVGEAAFSSSANELASIPADKARLRALYGKMSEAIKGTVARNVADGDLIVSNLEASNKAMHKWFGDKSILAPILGNKAIADENVLRRILSDTKKVEAFKGLFGADSDIVATVKAAALEDLVKVVAIRFVLLAMVRILVSQQCLSSFL